MRIFKDIILPLLFVGATTAASLLLLNTVEVGQRESAPAEEAGELLNAENGTVALHFRPFEIKSLRISRR